MASDQEPTDPDAPDRPLRMPDGVPSDWNQRVPGSVIRAAGIAAGVLVGIVALAATVQFAAEGRLAEEWRHILGGVGMGFPFLWIMLVAILAFMRARVDAERPRED